MKSEEVLNWEYPQFFFWSNQMDPNKSIALALYVIFSQFWSFPNLIKSSSNGSFKLSETGVIFASFATASSFDQLISLLSMTSSQLIHKLSQDAFQIGS